MQPLTQIPHQRRMQLSGLFIRMRFTICKKLFADSSRCIINVIGFRLIFSEYGALLQDVLRAADIALLEAKDQGRNQVVIAKMNTLTSAKGDINASA